MIKPIRRIALAVSVAIGIILMFLGVFVIELAYYIIAYLKWFVSGSKDMLKNDYAVSDYQGVYCDFWCKVWDFLNPDKDL